MIDLINDDCLIFLGGVEDNSIDLVIIDPPYEFTEHGGGGAFGSKKRSYHKEYESLFKQEVLRINDDKVRQRESIQAMSGGFDFRVLDECCRVLKKINIYVWCSKMQVRKILEYFEERNCFTDILTWHKTNPIPTCNGTYLNDTEYLIFAREKGVKVYGTYQTKSKYYVTPINTKDKKLYKHPTIKPLNIIENLIINSSQPGDVVMDCFMGSGTTGVACKRLNRSFVGVEIDNQYFEIAKKRIEETNNESREDRES